MAGLDTSICNLSCLDFLRAVCMCLWLMDEDSCIQFVYSLCLLGYYVLEHCFDQICFAYIMLDYCNISPL